MTPTPARFRAVLSDRESGRVTPPTGLEVIVNDRCTICCRQCNHASQIQAKFNAVPVPVLVLVPVPDPETAGRDLVALARVYRSAYAQNDR
jgi:hypothetical protein